MNNIINSTLNYLFIGLFFSMLIACEESPQSTAHLTPGDLKGQYQLAQDYLNNSAGKNDVNKAVKLLEHIAELGYTPAQNKLGFLYSQGLYVQKDPALAIQWYEKAATAGFTISQYNVAEMYRLGIGTEKDVKIAINWYRQASLNGYPLAMLRMAESYSKGEGSRKDPVNAYAWYQMAKENGVNIPDSFITSIARQLTEEQLAEADILVEDIKRNQKINRQ